MKVGIILALTRFRKKQRLYRRMGKKMNYIHLDYLKYRAGQDRPRVLVDAVHAADPRSDLFTGEIAETIAERAGCHSIIATVSRDVADLNRPPNQRNADAVQEYRQTLQTLLQASNLTGADKTLKQPFLLMALHGMRDRPNKDIELGTLYGRSCSPSVRDWIAERFHTWSRLSRTGRHQPIVVIDQVFVGDQSIAFHRQSDPETNYRGYGHQFHTVQIEIAYWLRKQHRSELVELFNTLVADFATDFSSDGHNCDEIAI